MSDDRHAPLQEPESTCKCNRAIRKHRYQTLASSPVALCGRERVMRVLVEKYQSLGSTSSTAYTGALTLSLHSTHNAYTHTHTLSLSLSHTHTHTHTRARAHTLNKNDDLKNRRSLSKRREEQFVNSINIDFEAGRPMIDPDLK